MGFVSKRVRRVADAWRSGLSRVIPRVLVPPAREYPLRLCVRYPDAGDWPQQPELERALAPLGSVVPIVYESAFDPLSTGVWNAAMEAALTAAVDLEVPHGWDGEAWIDHESLFVEWSAAATTSGEAQEIAAFYARLLGHCREQRPLAQWGLFGWPRRRRSDVSVVQFQQKLVDSQAVFVAAQLVGISCYVKTREPDADIDAQFVELLSTARTWAHPTWCWVTTRFGRNDPEAALGRVVPEHMLLERQRLITERAAPPVAGFVLWEGLRSDDDADRAEALVCVSRGAKLIYDTLGM